MKTRKYIALVGITLLWAGCSKPAKPSVSGPHSFFINEPDGRALVVNPDNGMTEMEPNREAAETKVPWSLTSEVNPQDPQIPNR